MKTPAEKVRQAIVNKTYTIKQDSECRCTFDWDTRNNDFRSELVCDISSDCCYQTQSLIIDGETIATYIRDETISEYNVDNYPDDYDGDDDDAILRQDIYDLVAMSEVWGREDNGYSTEHNDNKRASLIDYINGLVADGWLLYRDKERGFANEYTCILFSPTANKDEIGTDEIGDAWVEMSVEAWVDKYLYAGDAATQAFNGFKIVE